VTYLGHWTIIVVQLPIQLQNPKSRNSFFNQFQEPKSRKPKSQKMPITAIDSHQQQQPATTWAIGPFHHSQPYNGSFNQFQNPKSRRSNRLSSTNNKLSHHSISLISSTRCVKLSAYTYLWWKQQSVYRCHAENHTQTTIRMAGQQRHSFVNGYPVATSLQ